MFCTSLISRTGHITEENVVSIFCASVPAIGEKASLWGNQAANERKGGGVGEELFPSPTTLPVCFIVSISMASS